MHSLEWYGQQAGDLMVIGAMSPEEVEWLVRDYGSRRDWYRASLSRGL